MNNNFSLSIELIEDEPESYEYDISFLDEDGVRWSESSIYPTIEMCFDSAMNYYSEVTHGYTPEEDDEDIYSAIMDDEDFD